MAVCPTCGEVYFADHHTGRPMEEWEAWEVLAKLDGECPDHPGRFTTGR